MPFASTFGQRVRRLRETRNLTQVEVAQAMGCQPSAISHIESDRRAPSLQNLIHLILALRLGPLESFSLLMGKR